MWLDIPAIEGLWCGWIVKPRTPAQRAAMVRNLRKGNPRAYTKPKDEPVESEPDGSQGAPREKPPLYKGGKQATVTTPAKTGKPASPTTTSDAKNVSRETQTKKRGVFDDVWDRVFG